MLFNDDIHLDKGFGIHINKSVSSNIVIFMIIAFILLSIFGALDLFISKNIAAFITRLFPIILILAILFLKVYKPEQTKTITDVSHIFMASIPAMSYALIIIYYDTKYYDENIYYALVSIFLLSLILHTSTRTTYIIYFAPFILFLIGFYIFNDYTLQSLKSIAGLPPILIFGLIINRIRYKITYEYYSATVNLKAEKEKSAKLYDILNLKNESLELQKEEVENQNETLEDYAASLESRTNQLALVNIDLKEANATKNRFFSIIAHDLKSPFNTLLGFSDFLLTNNDISKEEQYKYIKIIHDSASKTYNLLENLLKWSMSQQGALKFQESTFNINLLIDNTCDFYKESLDKKHITIEKDISNNLTVKADKEMIYTVLRNLVNNAIKYSRPNNNIIIRTEIMSYQQVSYAQISIKDNGVGISESIIPKLFKVEENISSLGTAKETGTGLGLMLCKEFISKHNGQIWVHSKEEIGSEFFFTIPLSNG